MKRASGLPLLSLLSCALILCCSIVNLAQNREKFVISAKAGGINAITGQADIHGRGNGDWQRLSITDDMDAGDRIRTASDGRVEILLNPGSYLRVGANSEVELSDNTLSNIEVRLLRGTAIVETAGMDGLDLNINIRTPHTKLAIVRQGLYRLNVVPEDSTELIVRKGRVILSDSHTKVKGGNKVVFSATNVSVAKLTKEEKKLQEDVDVWSKQRGEMLAKANRRISDRMMNSAFASFNSPFGSRLGFWWYSGLAGCYTFLPYYRGIGSPYGDYRTSLYSNHYSNRYGWSNPQRNNTGYGNGTGSTQTSGGSSSNGSSSTSGGSRRGYQAPPSRPTPTMDRPSPRRVDSESGRPMPRKNLERLPNK